MKEFKYVITDELGIHARPAGLLVKEAKKYASSVKLATVAKTVDAKGIMGVMSLGAKKGHEVTIMCDGADEDAAIAAMNPVKDIYGDEHAFGLMVDSKDNKTLVQAMLEKGKVGMYNFHIEKGCPGQPAEVVANNSSCRGICCVDTYRSDSNWYGWILMFDQTGETYVQYIRNAVPQGWRKVATTLVEA